MGILGFFRRRDPFASMASESVRQQYRINELEIGIAAARYALRRGRASEALWLLDCMLDDASKREAG